MPEEKLPLTPEEEERWAQLEINEKKAEEGHQPCSPKGARRELQTDGPQAENNNDDLPRCLCLVVYLTLTYRSSKVSRYSIK